MNEPHNMKKYSTFLGNIALVLLGLGIALGAMELLLRSGSRARFALILLCDEYAHL